MVDKTERPAGRRWPARLILYILVLAALSLLLRLERARRQEGLRGARERSAALVSTRPVDRAKAERARFYQARYYLGYSHSMSYAVADFIRRLDGIFRPGQVLGLRIDTSTQHFDFELAVGIAANAPGPQTLEFSRLLDGIRGFPGVTRAFFLERGPAAGAGRGPGQRFSITGQAELQ